MSDNRKVTIESTVKYGIVVSLPDLRYNRTFNREMQSAKIDFDIMEEALQRPGFRNFFRDGLLRVVDKQDRIDLGLESGSRGDDIEENIALTTKDIVSYLKGTEKALKGIIVKVNDEVFKRFVNVAITSKISDYKVIDILNQEAEKREIDIEMTQLFKLAKDASKPVSEEE